MPASTSAPAPHDHGLGNPAGSRDQNRANAGNALRQLMGDMRVKGPVKMHFPSAIECINDLVWVIEAGDGDSAAKGRSELIKDLQKLQEDLKHCRLLAKTVTKEDVDAIEKACRILMGFVDTYSSNPKPLVKKLTETVVTTIQELTNCLSYMERSVSAQGMGNGGYLSTAMKHMDQASRALGDCLIEINKLNMQTPAIQTAESETADAAAPTPQVPERKQAPAEATHASPAAPAPAPIAARAPANLDEMLSSVVNSMTGIAEDNSTTRNIKVKVLAAKARLAAQGELPLRISNAKDQIVEALEMKSPPIPSHTLTDLMNLLKGLEALEKLAVTALPPAGLSTEGTAPQNKSPPASPVEKSAVEEPVATVTETVETHAPEKLESIAPAAKTQGTGKKTALQKPRFAIVPEPDRHAEERQSPKPLKLTDEDRRALYQIVLSERLPTERMPRTYSRTLRAAVLLGLSGDPERSAIMHRGQVSDGFVDALRHGYEKYGMRAIEKEYSIHDRALREAKAEPKAKGDKASAKEPQTGAEVPAPSSSGQSRAKGGSGDLLRREVFALDVTPQIFVIDARTIININVNSAGPKATASPIATKTIPIATPVGIGESVKHAPAPAETAAEPKSTGLREMSAFELKRLVKAAKAIEKDTRGYQPGKRARVILALLKSESANAAARSEKVAYSYTRQLRDRFNEDGLAVLERGYSLAAGKTIAYEPKRKSGAAKHAVQSKFAEPKLLKLRNITSSERKRLEALSTPANADVYGSNTTPVGKRARVLLLISNAGSAAEGGRKANVALSFARLLTHRFNEDGFKVLEQGYSVIKGKLIAPRQSAKSSKSVEIKPAAQKRIPEAAVEVRKPNAVQLTGLQKQKLHGIIKSEPRVEKGWRKFSLRRRAEVLLALSEENPVRKKIANECGVSDCFVDGIAVGFKRFGMKVLEPGYSVATRKYTERKPEKKSKDAEPETVPSKRGVQTKLKPPLTRSVEEAAAEVAERATPAKPEDTSRTPTALKFRGFSSEEIEKRLREVLNRDPDIRNKNGVFPPEMRAKVLLKMHRGMPVRTVAIREGIRKKNLKILFKLSAAFEKDGFGVLESTYDLSKLIRGKPSIKRQGLKPRAETKVLKEVQIPMTETEEEPVEDSSAELGGAVTDHTRKTPQANSTEGEIKVCRSCGLPLRMNEDNKLECPSHGVGVPYSYQKVGGDKGNHGVIVNPPSKW